MLRAPGLAPAGAKDVTTHSGGGPGPVTLSLVRAGAPTRALVGTPQTKEDTMPDKMYVCVAPIGVEAFDSKYKSTLPRLMKDKFERAINNSSKLTTKPPADKTAEGFYLDGNLSLKKTDKGIDGKMDMALASWPKKAIFGTATNKAFTDVPNPARIDGDVTALVDAIMDDVKAKVIKTLEGRVK